MAALRASALAPLAVERRAVGQTDTPSVAVARGYQLNGEVRRMRIKNHVFGSKRERELYRTLRSHWAPWPIYPQLPFQAIIDFQTSPSLSGKEKGFLRRTSVDYTFCGKEDRPILSIEFDGLGDGFSRDVEYVQQKHTDDPMRKTKFDLKLRVCREAGYPLLIVASEEAQSIGPELHETIVDGIVGQILSQKYFETKSVPEIQEVLRQREGFLSGMSQDQEMDYVGGMFDGFRIVAESTMDRIVKKADEYEMLGIERGISTSYVEQHLHDPELPEIIPGDLQNLNDRIEAIRNATRVGCRLALKTPSVPIIQTAWVRNFDDRWVVPYKVAKNVATLLLFRRALELHSRQSVATT